MKLHYIFHSESSAASFPSAASRLRAASRTRSKRAARAAAAGPEPFRKPRTT